MNEFFDSMDYFAGNSQLNEYETAPYFLQLSQKLTSDCLLIYNFLPEFTCYEPKIVLTMKKKQFYVYNR